MGNAESNINPPTFKIPNKNSVYSHEELAEIYTEYYQDINDYFDDNVNLFYNYNNRNIKNEIFTKYDNFNIDKMDKYIFKMSENSANGIIYKSVYQYNNEEEKRKFFVAIKCSMEKNTDNNYYEYTIGKCINEIKKYFPNFIYTFNYNFIHKRLSKKY